VFSGLRTLLLDDGSMVADGGGYNEHQDCSFLYFRAADGRHRLELIARGRHPQVVAQHLARHRAGMTEVEPPADQPLRLLTGAWATQARWPHS